MTETTTKTETECPRPDLPMLLEDFTRHKERKRLFAWGARWLAVKKEGPGALITILAGPLKGQTLRVAPASPGGRRVGSLPAAEIALSVARTDRWLPTLAQAELLLEVLLVEAQRAKPKPEGA